MGCYVGIDIGAVSVKAAVLADGAAATRLAEPQASKLGEPLAQPAGQGLLWVTHYRRTQGRPVEASVQLLDEIIALVGPDAITGLAVAGSGAAAVANQLGVRRVNEFKALSAAAAILVPGIHTLFEMGGETSKFLQLQRSADGLVSIVDYQTNGDCAAGTGSFLDQQAGRLHYEVEQIGPIVQSAARAAQIAGRCSVFAKSDMIHAQQKGYKPEEVLRGLCNAVARNFRSAVFRSRRLDPPAAFVGGVAANSAVVRAMREAFELEENQLVVPAGHAHFVAVGAALEARAAGSDALRRLAALRAAGEESADRARKFPTVAPLSTHRVLLLRDQVKPYELPYDGSIVDVYLGIDIGSVSTNLVLIDDEGNMVDEVYVRTRGRPIEVVEENLLDMANRLGSRIRICGVGTTGSGRELIGELVGADCVKDEITCHKAGANFIGERMIGCVPDTIFEIGGQDSKYISLSDGVVVDFTMNEACAAGTGSFLEERAEELGVSIKGEFAALALASEGPIRLGERCTVFMEHDVNNYMQRGAATGDLVAGLAYSIAYNYINRVVRGRKIGKCIFFQGGTAYNDAVAAAFASILDTEIIVPPYNGVIGAVGAALLAREAVLSGSGIAAAQREAQPAGAGTYVSDRPRTATRFRGFEVAKVHYTLREFTCKGCSNSCAIQEFDVEGEKTYWGDKCSDRFRKRAKSDRRPIIADLEAMRRGWLMDETGLPAVPANAPTVGVPLSMYSLELLPFYRTLLAHCGLKAVVSEPTNRRIVDAGLAAVVAEPCFPIIVAHGHVADLVAKGVDYLWLPSVMNGETRWMENESHVCPWGQTLPHVVRHSPAFAQVRAEQWLTPVLSFRQGPGNIRRELRKLAERLDISRKVMDWAVDAAFEAQAAFRAKCLSAGAEALAKLEKTGQGGIVMFGRPYNVHDAGVNLSMMRKMREYYGVNVIPIDFLDVDDIDIRDINDNMFWNYGRRIIATAKLLADHPNLHAVYITNFKCGPDSFLKHFIRPASGKPFLTLQFDGHSNDAGMMTRCEAYLDSKGFLRPQNEVAPVGQGQDARVGAEEA